jgi:hypothetical protein
MSIGGFPVRLAGKEPQMDTIRKYGPYVAVELLLPGGTLLAIALYFFRRACRSGVFPFDYWA